MKIAGLQKMTLLDYPGKVACTVFLQGCNLRCPFCHNSELLDPAQPGTLTQEALLEFLKKRRGILDGVCITGGEPTLQKDLPELLRAIKALGYPVKLDTNGFQPKMLRSLVAEGLVDYVAMDVKNSPSRYGETVGIPGVSLQAVEESLQFLIFSGVDYELRTTVSQEFHREEDIRQIAGWLQTLTHGKKVKRIFLQLFVDRDSVLQSGLHTVSGEKVRAFREILALWGDFVEIRG